MTRARWAVVRIVAFVLVTGAFTVALGLVVANVRIGPHHSYSAMFTDVSGLKDGQEVRSAGVEVGKVTDVSLLGTRALATFTVDSAVPMTTATRAAIRWKNVIGDRFIDLVAADATASPLPPGGTIPDNRTEPSLDLDQLSNGFRPLFQGLNPAQVNQLSGELIQVFQGQGGTLQNLFNDLGTFTNGLADRDAVIGEVVANLNTVLGTLDAHNGDLDNLIVQTDRLLAGLNNDRDPITSSAARIASASGNVASLLARIRPDTKADIDQVGRLARLLNRNEDQINTDLSHTAPALNALTQLGRTGAFFSFYLCGVQVRTTDPAGNVVQTPMIAGGAARCQ